MSQPDTLTVPEPAHIVGQGPAYTRLSVADIGLILRLHAEGKTQVEIAQRLGKDQTSISRALRRLAQDSTEAATALFKARAYKTAQRVTSIAEKEDNPDVALKAAKVVLAASGVTERVSGVNVGVQVVIGTPGSPAVDASTITVTRVGE